MQRLFSWSEDDDSAAAALHPKRRAETHSERSPAKRRRIADHTYSLGDNDDDVPSGAIRVQTDSQAQCNDCGRWVNLRNFRDHYLHRCNFRVRSMFRLSQAELTQTAGYSTRRGA